MSHVHPSNATDAAATVVAPAKELTLAQAILAACDRDPDAAEIVAEALRGRLVAEIAPILGRVHGQDAEDVVDDFFVAMLDGALTIAPGGPTVQRLMSKTRNFARSHLHALRGN